MTFFTSFSKEPSPKKSKGQVMMLSKSKWRRPYFLTFYVKDNQLHLMLPLVFFLGLFEAFMSKTFLTVSALISNFLWTGSSHQTLDKHKKLKFFNVGTCRDKYSSTVFEISVTVMNASVIRFSVSGFGYEKMMNSTGIHGRSIVKLGFILKLSSNAL